MSQSALVTARRKDNISWESEVNVLRSATQQASAISVTKTRVGLHVVIHRGEDGWFVARCLQLPAAISQGKTRKEVIRNIEEAISLVVGDLHEVLEVASNFQS